MSLNFVTLDVETADSAFPESICQLGVAVVEHGAIVENFTRTINTAHRLGWWQQNNLTISYDDISSAPSFLEIGRSIAHLMSGPVFSHTPYDRFSIDRACALHGISFSETVWLDSARLARRAWPAKYARKGYGLSNIAADLGIEFKHHDAGEDARVVAEIVIQASLEHSLDIQGWIARLNGPIASGKSASRKPDLRREGHEDGPLHGESIVLTGGFDLSKPEQADLASRMGCEVANGVTKKTTLVVVGDSRFARGERSGKWRRAEDLIQQGVPIKIMSESAFRELVQSLD